MARPGCSVLLASVFFLTACAAPPPLPEDSGPVVALMAERLELARDVAWVKSVEGLPVRDPEREAAVMKKLVAQGEAAGIDAPLVTRFVRAQIEASCAEQEAWLARWKKGEPLPAGEPPTLDVLRARIDRNSALLVAEWAAAPATPPAAARARLRSSVINPRSAAIAAAGFATP